MRPFSFTDALAQAEQLARQSLPVELHERLSCAVSLVRQGSVFQDDSGHWTVASASTPDKRYTVNGSCSCEDAFYRAPDGRCKHKLAQYLARKVQALLSVAQTGAPEPPPEVIGSGTNNAPLYEAAASVNVRVQVAGREVQWTLRDSDEGRLATRLEALLERYPAPQPVAQTASQGQDLCPLHHVPMQTNQKDGRSWKSHRTAEGWCKGYQRGR
jgi:hypothetical protein